jgi:hypothetical protein
MLESVILEDGLAESVLGLENLLIGNSEGSEEEKKDFKKASDAEKELKQISKLIGIDEEEMRTLYDSMTPEDARDIVVKTIERIPMGLMKGTLWTLDNLKKFGGKIICWASVASPREAAMIGASVMILTMGEGNIGETFCEESDDVKKDDADGSGAMAGSEKGPESCCSKGQPVHSSNLHRILMVKK